MRKQVLWRPGLCDFLLYNINTFTGSLFGLFQHHMPIPKYDFLHLLTDQSFNDPTKHSMALEILILCETLQIRNFLRISLTCIGASSCGYDELTQASEIFL